MNAKATFAAVLLGGACFCLPAAAQTSPSHPAVIMQPQTEPLFVRDADNGKTVQFKSNSVIIVRLAESGDQRWELTNITRNLSASNPVVSDHTPTQGASGRRDYVVSFWPEMWDDVALTFSLKDGSGKVMRTFNVTLVSATANGTGH